jgi:hypothetical protein
MRALLLGALLLAPCAAPPDTPALRQQCYSGCMADMQRRLDGSGGMSTGPYGPGTCAWHCAPTPSDPAPPPYAPDTPACLVRLRVGCGDLPTWEAWRQEDNHRHRWPDEYRGLCEQRSSDCRRWLGW